MSIFKDLLELISERDKNVKISNYLYVKLLEESGLETDKVGLLVNNIIADRYSKIATKNEEREEMENHERELLSYYIMLDKYLFATINRNVDIGITNALVGREDSHCVYTLKEYEISYTYKCIKLVLEKNGESYPIKFGSIEDIRFMDNGERLKTWIYMPRFNWRFYLHYDKEAISDNLSSGKLEIPKQEA